MFDRKLSTSQLVALTAIFASLNVVSDSLMSLPEPPSGVWYSWNFLIVPLTGIVLGPLLGFFSVLVGVFVGHCVYFIDMYEFLYTVGAPIGAAVSALLFRGKWKLALSYYTILFLAYFITPIAWQLPIWGMWDTYIAFAVLIGLVFLFKKGVGGLQDRTRPILLAAAAFIGLEADVLFRIFVFVPCQTFRLFYGFSVESLKLIWVSGAVFTPMKVALSVAATVAVGLPLMRVLRKSGFLVDDSGCLDSSIDSTR